jgi:hypothetical protein
MKNWMDEQLEVLLPKYPLRGALQYMTKRWASLAWILESAAIPLENNAAEGMVKLRVMPGRTTSSSPAWSAASRR